MTESIRAKDIAIYIDGRKPETVERVEIDGQSKFLDVFRIPIEKLHFNIRNGRFASELIAREKQLKRKLDPLNRADALEIRSLLLDQNPKETDILKRDLLRHEQLDPGIITHDGAVINANRRMAILSLLYEETRDEKWAFLKVGILSAKVGEQDLWRIEAGLQFGKDFRLEYGPINELLKLREGIECGLDPKDISVSLLGRFDVEGINARLSVLTLIDDFLVYVDRPGEYEIIGQKRLMEKFNSLNGNVLSPLKKKEELSRAELAKLTEVAFAIINNTNLKHWDIRKLVQIARQPDAFNALKKTLPSTPLDAKEEVLVDAFKAADELVEDKKEKDKPGRLIQRALSALQSIDGSSSLLASKEVQQSLHSLITCATALRRP